MISYRSVIVFLALLPVVAAFVLGNMCLGRGNMLYWVHAIPILLSWQTYHKFVRARGYTNGDRAVQINSMCEVLYTSHESVATEMANMVVKLDEGSAVRGSNLGLLRLAQQPFTCVDSPVYSDGYCGMGLGMPHGDHSKIRPFLDELLGSGDGTSGWKESGNYWSLDGIRASAQEFLQGRDTLSMGRDVGNFFLIEFHKLMFGLTVTEAQANDMQNFFDNLLTTAVLPIIPMVTKVRKIREQRTQYVDTYVSAIEDSKENGYFSTLDPADIALAANGLLDALTFAALPSLSSVAAAVTAAYLHDLGGIQDNLNWDTPNDVGRAIMESVRVYPPVLGIPYVEDNVRYESLAGYSGYDSTVFGDDSHNYKVRFATVDNYRDVLINWADRAGPITGKPETSHICPARSLAYNVLLGFLIELDVPSWMEGPDGKPKVKPDGSGPRFWDDFPIQKIAPAL